MKKILPLVMAASFCVFPLLTAACGKSKTRHASPTLDNLVITATDTGSITLARPVFSRPTAASLTINAYLGLDSAISVTGSDVANELQGPVDVTAAGCVFSGLDPNTLYRIIVVAVYSGGYSVKQIAQSTGAIAPVMNPLVITYATAESISLTMPAMATAGNPLPGVEAYLGLDGTINVSGSTVTGAIQGPLDVSSAGCVFETLLPYTVYRIIVVAHNSGGQDVKEIVQATMGIAPVMHEIVISSYDTTSLSIAQPTFYQAGIPLPSVNAYIGVEGTIAVSGAVVSGASEGPIDVSAGGHQFSGLNPAAVYRVIVVAQSGEGNAVQQIPLNRYGAIALRVYGQQGKFATGNSNVSATSLSLPIWVAKDANGIYITDNGNNRVLYFEGSSMTPSRVYGQGGDFTSGTANNGGINANSLTGPRAVAVVPGGIYIVDSDNNRVLFYPGTSTTASRVYGQGGDFTSNTANKDGTSADSLSSPRCVAVGTDGVYITDTGNNRVLFYAGTGTTATRVYGQGGSFTASTANNGGITADSLYNPRDIAVDAGGVYIADEENNRVLYFAGSDTTASRVYGQGGDFTTRTINKGGRSADSLAFPRVISISADGLYIADYGNQRILYFEGTGTTATRVYGQLDNFTTGGANAGGISAYSLSQPCGVTAVTGGVYIADTLNNRVLYFAGTSTAASAVYGQAGSLFTNRENSEGIGAVTLDRPQGIAMDAGGVYIADTYNNRVLYFAGTSTTATRVYGQGGSLDTNELNKGGVSADSLNSPTGIALSADGVYIADKKNNRVLYYAGTSTTATLVYGQGNNFASNGTGSPGMNTLNSPHAVAVVTGGVYITDSGNNRVLYFTGTSTSPSRVYGQGGSYTSVTSNNGGVSGNPTADSLFNPQGMAASDTGLYVADTYNNRVLYFAGTSTTASRVYGQGGDFTARTANNGGISADSLWNPEDVSLSATGIAIADKNNSRILSFIATTTTAAWVYGQGGSLTTGTANSGAIISPNCLNNPSGVKVSGSTVYIVDTLNSRVLAY